MLVLVTFLLLLAVLAFVGYPLLYPAAPQGDEPVAPAAGQREQLLGERENALAALKDLELEHAIGNLSDGDYEALRAAQRHKAVAILSELDRLGDAGLAPTSQPSALDHPALDERLEAEIARARQRLDGTIPGTAVGADGPAITCPACGATRSRHDNYCANCGAPLEGGAHEP